MRLQVRNELDILGWIDWPAEATVEGGTVRGFPIVRLLGGFGANWYAVMGDHMMTAQEAEKHFEGLRFVRNRCTIEIVR